MSMVSDQQNSSEILSNKIKMYTLKIIPFVGQDYSIGIEYDYELYQNIVVSTFFYLEVNWIF